MIYGYARVSTSDQDTTMQLDALNRAGVHRIYEETRSAVRSRPVLDAMLGDLIPGDQVVVYKLDRLARSMTHFVRVFDHLKAKRVAFRSLTEAVDTETVQGRMFLNLLGVAVGRAAEHRLDARNHLFGLKGFYNIVVRSQLQA